MERPGAPRPRAGACYEIRISAETFAGGRFRAMGPYERLRPGKIIEAKLPESDGDLVKGVTFLVLWNDRNEPVTIDLNPKGLSATFPYLQVHNNWDLIREGKDLVLRADFGPMPWGDAKEFKVVILPGELDFEDRHLDNRNNRVFLGASRQFNIRGKQKKRDYHSLGILPYAPEVGAGWLASPKLEKGKGDLGPAALQSYVEAKGTEPATLQIDVPNGPYIFNAALSGRDPNATVNIAVNDKADISGLKLQPDRLTAVSLSGRVRDGKLIISLAGSNWRLHGLSTVPLISEEEDYLFARSWWLAPDSFQEWYAGVEPLPPSNPYKFADPVSDRMAWTWNASLNSLEGSINGSSRAALDTPEAIAERIDEIKNDGYGVVVINGAHFRINIADSVKDAVLRRNDRLAVEEAHRQGLKVISHVDLNWVFYDGLPKMMEMVQRDPDVLQRSVFDPLRVAATFCLLSPVFEDELMNYLKRHLKETGVDGYMIDELTYYGDSYAGSNRFRELFKKRFGEELPYSPAGFLKEPSNPLWRKYIILRGEIQTEVNQRVANELRKINPNLILLGYTSQNFAGSRDSSRLIETGPPEGVEYFGNEFHPEDIVQNWRIAFMRLKERQGVASSWKAGPTWILPKVGRTPDQMLYAWALARMNRANGWIRSNEANGGLQEANKWSHQMKDEKAVPYSDIGVLLSDATVDVSPYGGEGTYYYNEEFGGWLQTLADENLQYDVIIERDILAGSLKQYKVLLLPNTAALSDELIERIKSFVKEGGVVIASYETGKFDAEGNPRESFALSDAMNLTEPQSKSGPARIEITHPSEEKDSPRSFESQMPQLAWTVKDPAKSKVLAWSQDKSSKWPAIMETPYGNGTFVYLAGNFLAKNYESRVAAEGSKTTIGRTRGSVYEAEREPLLNDIVRNIVEDLVGERLNTQPIEFPEGVIYTTFVEDDCPEQDAIVIQLLNLQGRPPLKKGDVVKKLTVIPRPTIPDDLKMVVRSATPITSGMATSLGSNEELPVKVTAQEGGAYEVSIPKQALHDYAIVRLYRNKAVQ